MPRFVLISTDPCERQCFIDTVLAKTENHALIWLKTVRDYVSYAEAYPIEDFLRIAEYIKNETDADVLDAMKEVLSWHRDT